MSKPSTRKGKNGIPVLKREQLGMGVRGKYFQQYVRHSNVVVLRQELLIHPGEFLREILDARSVSQARFARTVGVAPMRISHVMKGVRPVTAGLALLFGRALNQSPEYWLNLQAAYDLKVAQRAIGARRLNRVVELESI